jgi:hypothetical protein
MFKRTRNIISSSIVLYVVIRQFHIAHKKNDEKNLMTYHHKLQENVHDQLCLAAIHYLRGHYEEVSNHYIRQPMLIKNYYLKIENIQPSMCMLHCVTIRWIILMFQLKYCNPT